MDLADCLTSVGRTTDAAALQPHIDACLRDLLSRGDNVGTEGEATYEDGAIACTALQLAQYAGHARRAEAHEREPHTAGAADAAPTSAEYVTAALDLANGHRCLEYRSLDARCNGASMRFWESYWGIGWCAAARPRAVALLHRRRRLVTD
jgi:hypothetical protein